MIAENIFKEYKVKNKISLLKLAEQLRPGYKKIMVTLALYVIFALAIMIFITIATYNPSLTNPFSSFAEKVLSVTEIIASGILLVCIIFLKIVDSNYGPRTLKEHGEILTNKFINDIFLKKNDEQIKLLIAKMEEHNKNSRIKAILSSFKKLLFAIIPISINILFKYSTFNKDLKFDSIKNLGNNLTKTLGIEYTLFLSALIILFFVSIMKIVNMLIMSNYNSRKKIILRLKNKMLHRQWNRKTRCLETRKLRRKCSS